MFRLQGSALQLSAACFHLQSCQLLALVLLSHLHACRRPARCLQVVAVDLSVQPPSYGIQLPGGSYRETEGGRLQALPEQPPAVEGLGHRDAATEAKEEAARQLEQ